MIFNTLIVVKKALDSLMFGSSFSANFKTLCTNLGYY